MYVISKKMKAEIRTLLTHEFKGRECQFKSSLQVILEFYYDTFFKRIQDTIMEHFSSQDREDDSLVQDFIIKCGRSSLNIRTCSALDKILQNPNNLDALNYYAMKVNTRLNKNLPTTDLFKRKRYNPIARQSIKKVVRFKVDDVLSP